MSVEAIAAIGAQVGTALPLPAPAKIKSGPLPWRTACSWGSLSSDKARGY